MAPTPLPPFLRECAPSVHPLKQFFAKRGISQLVLANYLKCSPSRVSATRNGYRPMPRDVEWKLTQLVERLKNECGEVSNG